MDLSSIHIHTCSANTHTHLQCKHTYTPVVLRNVGVRTVDGFVLHEFVVWSVEGEGVRVCVTDGVVGQRVWRGASRGICAGPEYVVLVPVNTSSVRPHTLVEYE
jgi:hypothetical protein